MEQLIYYIANGFRTSIRDVALGHHNFLHHGSDLGDLSSVPKLISMLTAQGIS